MLAIRKCYVMFASQEIMKRKRDNDKTRIVFCFPYHIFPLPSTHSGIDEAIARQSKCKKDGRGLRLDREEFLCYNSENMVE